MDLSALGIKVTSSGVVKTTNELTAFSKASSAARQAARTPINVRVGNTGIAKALADIQKLDRALKGMGGRGNASSARLNVTGGAAAVREINRFAKAVTDARSKVGGGITVALKANGADAAVKQIGAFQKAVTSAQSASAKSADFNMSGFGEIERGANRASSSVIGLSGAVKSLAATVAAGFSISKIIHASDAYTMFGNQLKVVGIEGENLTRVQDRLFESANKYGVELGSLSTLYGRVSAVQKDLGASQEQMLQFTNGISAALKVQGGSAASASGALLQMSQALGSGVIRAEEFNSVLEGARPILQTVADNMDGVGGSVSKLRQLVIDGNLTSQEFFNAFLKGTDDLEAQAAKATGTIGQSFTALQNSFVVFIGQMNETYGISQKLAKAMKWLGDNLGLVAKVAGGLIITFGAYKVALAAATAVQLAFGGSLGLIAATVATTTAQFGLLAGAQVTYSAAAAFATTATKGFTAALLANPATAVAVAVAALAAGLYLYTTRTKEATAAQERHAQQSRTLARIESELSGELTNVANATGAAKDAALGRIAVLRTQAAEAARTARAEATLAAVQAGRRATELAAAAKVQGRGSAVDLATAGTGVLPFNVQNSVKAEKALRAQERAAWDAGVAWREAEASLSRFDKMIEDATKPIKIIAAKTDGVSKSTKAAGKEMSEAAKKAEEWAKALEKLRVDVAVSVGGQAEGISKAADDIIKASEQELDNVLKGINARWEGEQRVIEAERIWEDQKKQRADEERRKAFAAAYTIVDIIGGAFGNLVGEFVNAIIPLVNVTSKLGKQLEAFSKGAVLGGAVGGVTGSRTGGALGGGLGQVAGEAIAPMLGKLGKFAGPLGAIAGGILGGVIGGLMKSTPRASATVSIIAGEAMDTAIKGSSGKLKKAAGQMADGVIDGLLGLADQLGAQLVGDASVSIGMRKGNYRVDPTGQGITKTSKGAIDFGEDQGAAIAYAMQIAIQQGVLGGLSESMKRLIMADGDLQTQIQKALSFKGVFDDLAQRDDPAKWAQDEITRWHDAMAKIFKEAGATGDELAELERLTGLKRADAVKDAADKLVEAERAAQERTREIRDKNIELLQAQGKVEEAEAAARQARIDDAPEHLRAIQQAIEVANLLADAETKLAERRQMAIDNFQRENGLMERLAGAQGDTATVTRLQRENELRLAGDALTRSYLLQIYAAEDLSETNALALKAAEDAATKLKAVADERYGLEGRLLELQGDTAALRQRELDTLDPANRALLEMIFSLEDFKTSAEAAAAAQKEITDEIDGLTRQWLELTGQTQTLRGMDLELLKSDEARELQQRIWNYQDALERQKVAQEAATTAMDDYNQRLDDARSVLVSAYESESSALQSTIDKFRDFSSAIREFRDGLIGSGNPAFGLAQAQATFTNTSRMAGLGNEASLSAFTGDAQSYLDAAKASGTYEQYQRAMASVLAGSNGAIKSADSMVSMSQRQLDQMTGIMETLGLIREDNVSFNDALTDYNKLLTEEAIPQFTETVSVSMDRMARAVDDGTESAQKTGEKAQVTLETMTIAINRMERLLSRMERDGSFAVTLDGEKVQIDGIVATQGAVTVTNTPLPVDQV